jgi:hypothetical protein
MSHQMIQGLQIAMSIKSDTDLQRCDSLHCGSTAALTFDKLIFTYLLTAVGLTPCGSSTAHIYTQTVHRTAQ